MIRPILALIVWLVAMTAQAADPPKVAVLGDSLTAGAGLAKGQGLLPALDRWLARHGAKVAWRDHSLSGDTTYGGRVRAAYAFRGADAAVVALGGNDIGLRIDPARSLANLDAILTRAGAGGRPVLILGVAPPPLGWSHRTDPFAGNGAAWRDIWPQLAARHGAVLVDNLYAPIFAEPSDAGLVQADGIHPSAKGAEAMAAVIGPKLLTLLARLDR